LGTATRNQVQAIEVGKAKVDNKSIMDALQRQRLPGLAIVRHIHLISGLNECPTEEGVDSDIILDK